MSLSAKCRIKCQREPGSIRCCANKRFFCDVCCPVDNPSQSSFVAHAVVVHGTRRNTERFDDADGHTLLDPTRRRSVPIWYLPLYRRGARRR
jgi:hypothetical protein